jgi:hypothetical protein
MTITKTQIPAFEIFSLATTVSPPPVTVRHMYAATIASAPDYGGLTSPISKGNARGEQAMCI